MSTLVSEPVQSLNPFVVYVNVFGARDSKEPWVHNDFRASEEDDEIEKELKEHFLGRVGNDGFSSNGSAPMFSLTDWFKFCDEQEAKFEKGNFDSLILIIRAQLNEDGEVAFGNGWSSTQCDSLSDCYSVWASNVPQFICLDFYKSHQKGGNDLQGITNQFSKYPGINPKNLCVSLSLSTKNLLSRLKGDKGGNLSNIHKFWSQTTARNDSSQSMRVYNQPTKWTMLVKWPFEPLPEDIREWSHAHIQQWMGSLSSKKQGFINLVLAGNPGMDGLSFVRRVQTQGSNLVTNSAHLRWLRKQIKTMILANGSIAPGALNLCGMNTQRGLYNQGNTCYMNSALQSMIVIPVFMEKCLDGSITGSKRSHSMPMTQAWLNFVKRMFDGSSRPYRPAEVRRELGRIDPLFSSGCQEDSIRVITNLLQRMNEEISGIPSRIQKKIVRPQRGMKWEDSMYKQFAHMFAQQLAKSQTVIEELFDGIEVEITTCLKCGCPTRYFHPYRGMDIPVTTFGNEKGYAEQILHDYRHAERIYRQVDAKKQPPSSSSSYSTTSRRRKQAKNIDSNRIILTDLDSCLDSYEDTQLLNHERRTYHCPVCREESRYLSWCKMVLTTPKVLVIHFDRFKKGSKYDHLVDYPLVLKKWNEIYHLVSVCIHHGYSCKGGHYIASVRSLNDGQWRIMNDSSVGGASEFGSIQDAIILVYVRED